VQLPQADGAVLAAAGAHQARGVVAHAADGPVVTLQRAQDLAAGHVEFSQPQVRSTLPVGTDD
jgi:hypothetical protein